MSRNLLQLSGSLLIAVLALVSLSATLGAASLPSQASPAQSIAIPRTYVMSAWEVTWTATNWYVMESSAPAEALKHNSAQSGSTIAREYADGTWEDLPFTWHATHDQEYTNGPMPCPGGGFLTNHYTLSIIDPDRYSAGSHPELRVVPFQGSDGKWYANLQFAIGGDLFTWRWLTDQTDCDGTVTNATATEPTDSIGSCFSEFGSLLLTGDDQGDVFTYNEETSQTHCMAAGRGTETGGHTVDVTVKKLATETPTPTMTPTATATATPTVTPTAKAKSCPPGTIPVTISALDKRTFVVTDSITLKAKLCDATPNVPVRWTVIGLDAAKDITGFPKNEVHNTDASGLSSFSFTPEKSKALRDNRHTAWTQGSRSANLPISFEVTAKATIYGKEYAARLSQTSLGPLQQDESDQLRQEYYDYDTPECGVPIPDRTEVFDSLAGGYNVGNYSKQLSNDLPGHYDDIVAAYHGWSITVDVQFKGKTYTATGTIPMTATVTITSGYRNPQRNKAAGSLNVCGSNKAISKHVTGSALDLVVQQVRAQVQFQVKGKTKTRWVNLPVDKTLYPVLQDAAHTIVKTAICEILINGKPTQKPCTMSGSGKHLHVQW